MSFMLHIETAGITYALVGLKPISTVGVLKNHIEREFGIKPSNQLLFFQRTILQHDEKTLEEYHVEDGSHIRLTVPRNQLKRSKSAESMEED